MSQYKRKTDYGVSDFYGLLEAIKEIKIKNTTVTHTSRTFNIPKTSLYRYIARFDAQVADISSISESKLLEVVKQISSHSRAQEVFSSDVEEALVDYIKSCQSKLNNTDFRMMVYRFARNMEVDYPSNWDKHQMASTLWYHSFAQRHSYLNLNASSGANNVKEDKDNKKVRTHSKPSSSIISDTAEVQVFSCEQEEELINYIKKCRVKNKKLNMRDFRMLVFRFARQMHIDYPSNWDKDKMSSKQWYYAFAQRHSDLNLNTLERTPFFEAIPEVNIEESVTREQPSTSSSSSPTLNLSSDIPSIESFQAIMPNKPKCTDILQAIKEIKMCNQTLSDTARTFKMSEKDLLHYITQFDAEISEISFLDDEDLLTVVKQIAASPTESQNSTEGIDSKEVATYIDPSSYEDHTSKSSISSAHKPVSIKKIDKSYSSTLLEAIKEVKHFKCSVRGTARRYNLPYTTLSRYIARFDSEVSDISLFKDDQLLNVVKRCTTRTNTGPQIFTTEEEEALVHYIKQWRQQNNGLSEIDLRKLAFQFAHANQVDYPANWDRNEMANKKWFCTFMQRHEYISVPMEIELNESNEEIATSTSSMLSAFEPSPQKTTNHTDFNVLLQAIKEVKINNSSLRATSRKFNIPKTSLSGYINKFDDEVFDITSYSDNELLRIVKRSVTFSKISQVFSIKEEEVLVDYIKNCLNREGKLNINEFRRRAYQFAQDRQIDYPAKWDKDNMVGRYWYYSFVQRHSYLNLSLSTKSNSSKERTDDLKDMMEPYIPLSDESNSCSDKSTNELLMPMSIERVCSTSQKPRKRQNTTVSPKKFAPPTKRVRKVLPSTVLPEDNAFCMICTKRLPCKLSSENSVIYSEFNRPVHLRCAEMKVAC